MDPIKTSPSPEIFKHSKRRLSENAAAKRKKRFRIWLEGKDIAFASPEAESSYRERVSMILDAVELKRSPVRVPVCPSTGHFPLEYAGISFHSAMYERGRIAEAWKKFYADFHPDSFSNPFIGSGTILELLDCNMYRWAGHGLERNCEHQFVENEYMKAEEYKDLLQDPTWFHLSRYLPRICGALKAFEKLPSIVNMRSMSSIAGAVLPFSTPEFRNILSTLQEAGQAASQWLGESRKLADDLKRQGYPSLAGGVSEAPFDTIGDAYRGTRGVLTDMFRHPDLLLEACEKFVPPLLEKAVGMADASGVPLVFMPLHKGADEFMSRDQFRRFYWPSLQKVLLGLIEEGLIPLCFAEANYATRLDIISDLPKGSVIWWFEKTDMFRAKEVLGDTCCIMGNVSNDLLKIGTPEEVRSCCMQLVQRAGKDGGFILSTAAGMQGAKPENVRAMIESGRSFGSDGEWISRVRKYR